jgi:hypothetical protein
MAVSKIEQNGAKFGLFQGFLPDLEHTGVRALPGFCTVFIRAINKEKKWVPR